MTFFDASFGRPASVHGRASGRVNLIGEHTDYNGGFVLPTALAQQTTVALARRSDREVHVATSAFGAPARTASFALGSEAKQGDWRDFIQGTTWVLAREGHALGGFEVAVASAVPMGAGVSSSAALLVALFRALRAAFDLPFDDARIARLSQAVENDFVGARVGIMDQMAASLAEDGVALFLDTRDLSYRRVALPTAAMALFVVNSGVSHSHAHGGYNARRQECEDACRLLGVAQLRDVGADDLARLSALPPLLHRRARHVVTENARVLAAVQALEASDVVGLGRLFAASHASMRDDYEVSVKEIDCLVELAAADPDVFGARLTGGGFGGSIVGLARPGTAAAAAARVRTLYERRTGQKATILMPQSRSDEAMPI